VSRTRRLETKEEDMKRISTLIALTALAAALGVSDTAAAARNAPDGGRYRPGVVVTDPGLVLPMPRIRF
jgi:ABC-type sugar transport system substrate-binding protein